MRQSSKTSKSLHGKCLGNAAELMLLSFSIGSALAMDESADARQKRWGKRFREVLAEIAGQKLGGPPHQASGLFYCVATGSDVTPAVRPSHRTFVSVQGLSGAIPSHQGTQGFIAALRFRDEYPPILPQPHSPTPPPLPRLLRPDSSLSCPRSPALSPPAREFPPDSMDPRPTT